MADEIIVGKRTENDIALDLLKVVMTAAGSPDSVDAVLDLYHKCRVAMYVPIKQARYQLDGNLIFK
jgi:hypothetical protein